MRAMTAKGPRKRKIPLSFEHSAEAILRDLQAAFRQLVARIPAGVSKAADLQRALDIDPKLGWQVFKLASAKEPFAAGLDVPGRVSMRRFFKAASSHGVPASVTQRASQAFDQFEELIEEHAGDRDTFASMLSALAGPGAEDSQVDLQQRRAAFAANSHITGVQARTRFGCIAVHPGLSTDLADMLYLSGYIDLRWLRLSHLPFVINQIRIADTDDVQRRVPLHQPLDPEPAKSHGVSLLPQFCSQPLPQVREYYNAHKYLVTELIANGVGKSASVTYVTGEVSRNVCERYRNEHNENLRYHRMVRVACQFHISDVLIYDGLLGDGKREAFVLADFRCTDGSVDGRERDLLPIRCDVEHLGRGVDVMHTRDVPRYAEMMQYAFDRVGWDGEKFDVYRCRVEYPVMPSSVVVQFDLPEKPESGV